MFLRGGTNSSNPSHPTEESANFRSLSGGAVAREAGLGFESAEHLRAEQICAELPGRAAAVQCFASLAVAMLTEHHDGIQALACAMAGEVDTDLEPTVRRWSLWQGSSSVESVT